VCMVTYANSHRVLRGLAIISSPDSPHFATGSQRPFAALYTTAKVRAMDGGYFLSRRSSGVEVPREGARATFASQEIPHGVKIMSPAKLSKLDGYGDPEDSLALCWAPS
jgi:hypothetical protein